MTFENPSLMEDPRMAVMARKQEAATRGANDSELGAFDRIMQGLATGRYKNPQKAVEEAQAILDGKQDYH